MKSNDLGKLQEQTDESDILMMCLKIPRTEVIFDSFVEDKQINLIIEHPKRSENTLRNLVL